MHQEITISKERVRLAVKRLAKTDDGAIFMRLLHDVAQWDKRQAVQDRSRIVYADMREYLEKVDLIRIEHYVQIDDLSLGS